MNSNKIDAFVNRRSQNEKSVRKYSEDKKRSKKINNKIFKCEFEIIKIFFFFEYFSFLLKTKEKEMKFEKRNNIPVDDQVDGSLKVDMCLDGEDKRNL